LANNKIYGERVAGKTTSGMSYNNGVRDRSLSEENITEFDSKFKSIEIIHKKRSKDEDDNMIYKIKIRATGIREINVQ
jgi:regulator of sigma D